jgi:hypothetical protein
MQIGIGLPNTVLKIPGQLLVDWARRAEERGFPPWPPSTASPTPAMTR